MFYRVSGFAGEMVSGFEDLPPWRGTPAAKGPYAALVDFYDEHFRGEPVRVAVLLQPVAGQDGRGMATIQVAETLELRQTLARQILFDTLWRQALLLLVITAVVVWVVQRATRPVRETQRTAGAAQRERPGADRRRARAARAAAAGRRHQPGDGAAGAPAGLPEALRARHLAPAAHAAGGAAHAAAVGAARRRRPRPGAARDERHGRTRHAAGQPDAGAGQGGTAAPAGRGATGRLGRGRPRRGAGPGAADREAAARFRHRHRARAGTRARMGLARTDAQPAAQRHQAQCGRTAASVSA